jgi:hypothetical protein
MTGHRLPEATVADAEAVMDSLWQHGVEVTEVDPGRRWEVYVADPGIPHEAEGVQAVEKLLDEIHPGWRSAVRITGGGAAT